MADDEIAFPGHIRITRVRIARPTRRLDEVVRFYRDGLGLPLIDAFKDHEGYDGAMLGLPGSRYHLEFTSREGEDVDPAPHADDLLVLYCADEGSFTALADRARATGARPVEPENPYWRDKSVTFEDPDGRRVVVCRPLGEDGGPVSRSDGTPQPS